MHENVKETFSVFSLFPWVWLDLACCMLKPFVYLNEENKLRSAKQLGRKAKSLKLLCASSRVFRMWYTTFAYGIFYRHFQKV